MELNVKKEIKKKLRQVGGRNLSFKKVKHFIETSDNRDLILMLAAFTLGDQTLRDITAWNKLSEKFFKHYRSDILNYYRYECEPSVTKRLKVQNREVFIEQMASLKRAEVLGNCSFKAQAKAIIKVFDTGYNAGSLTTQLKNAVVD